MQTERVVSFAVIALLLGIVLYRGTVTGFLTSQIQQVRGLTEGCTDGDLGFSPSVASSVAAGNLVLRDSCYDAKGLFEAICNDGKAEYRYAKCDYEVATGSRCVQEGLNARCR